MLPVATLRRLWSLRRWAYAAYVVVAITRIPARTGYRLYAPGCDLRLTLENVALSMTKVPHVVLFGMFFLLTAIQFDRIDRRMMGCCFLATATLGWLVELEEGATRTGNCRLTDVLPDLAGALIAAALIVTIAMVRKR